VLATIEHHFFDETPQQDLTLSIRSSRISPDLWKTAGKTDNFAFQCLAQPYASYGLRRGLLSERLLSCPDLAQSCFPASLEFSGDETIIRMDDASAARNMSATTVSICAARTC
jgi:hypothetical protein